MRRRIVLPLLALGACFDPRALSTDATPADAALTTDGSVLDDVPPAPEDSRAPIDIASLDATASVDVPAVDGSASDVVVAEVPSALDAPAADTPSMDLGAPRDAAPGDVPLARDRVTPDAPAMDVTVSRDVTPLDAPGDLGLDVVRDAGTPAPTCAAGRGGSTVSVPRRVFALRDTGAEGWLGAVAVSDLDGDGARELIAARGPRLVVWRRDGSVRWARALGTARVWAAPVVGDFVGTNALELAAASGARVALFDAAGTMSPGFPVTVRDELRAIAGGDVSGDGRPELVVASTVTAGAGAREDLLTVLRGDGATLPGFPPNASGAGRCDSACDIAGAFDQNLAVGSLDGDLRADILAPMDNAYASWHRGTGEAFPVAPIFRGVTRSPGVRFIVNYAEAQQGWAMNEGTAEQAHFTNTAPAIADLDGDGTRELVMLSSVQNVSQSDRRRGVALWVVRADGTRPPAWVTPYRAASYLGGLTDLGGNIVAATNSVAVGDLDARSPGLEVVFAGFDGTIHCVGADRSLRWTYPFTTAANLFTAGVALADLSDDGVPEVIFATYSTQQGVSALYVLSASGAMLHRVPLPNRGAMAVPTAADFDGDGTLELFVSLKDAASDGAEVLGFNVAGSATRCLPWPTGRGNLLRNGAL